jgi:hypothetical protein
LKKMLGLRFLITIVSPGPAASNYPNEARRYSV